MCAELLTYQLSFTAEQAREMPMVDVLFEILKTTEPNSDGYPFPVLMDEVVKVKQLQVDPEQLLKLTAHLYTDINIDGRFASIVNRNWVLKSWPNIDKEKILSSDDIEDDEDFPIELEEEREDIADGGLLEDEDAFPGIAGDDDDVDDDIDSKPVDEDLPDIEGLPDLDGEIIDLEDEQEADEFDGEDSENFDDSDDDL